jgi:hypothetical protein
MSVPYQAGLMAVALVLSAVAGKPALAAKASPTVQAAADACYGKTPAAWVRLVEACSTMVNTKVRPDLKAAAHFNRGAAY